MWYDVCKDYIWQAYTQYSNPLAPLCVQKTDKCSIYLEDGRILIDGIASWWSVCHGYNQPDLIQAATEQLNKMPHVMFAGLCHEKAYELAYQLVNMTDSDAFARVFFADSGSVATEIAIKMAVQYYYNRQEPQKNRIVCFENAYHGDTCGAMSVSDTINGMHGAFRNLPNNNLCIKLPKTEADLLEFEDFIIENKSQIAAVIIEPMVQCAGGMVFHEVHILKNIFQLVKKYNILFICDECAVGFYRLGFDFAFKYAGIKPDILTLGKALSGGMVTLAAVLTSQNVFDGFKGDATKTFMHGPTFMANPLACAISLASCKLFQQKQYNISQIEQAFSRLNKLKSLPYVIDVRILGALAVVEVKSGTFELAELRRLVPTYGIWIRPLLANNGNIIIYLAPPFIVSVAELEILITAIINLVAIKS